jgi:hypothetical protein
MKRAMCFLTEGLGGYGVLARAEMLEHRHNPDWLVQHPASVGELGEPGDELRQLVLNLLPTVLLHLHVEQLDRSAVKVCVESPSDAGVPLTEVLRLKATRMLAR